MDIVSHPVGYELVLVCVRRTGLCACVWVEQQPPSSAVLTQAVGRQGEPLGDRDRSLVFSKSNVNMS